MNIIKKDNFNNEKYLRDILIYRLNQVLILVSLSGLLSLNALQIKANYKNIKKANIEFELADINDISISDIKQKIFNSSKLTNEEKEFLYNEELLSDILQLVNQSNYAKYCYNEKFNDINIINYDDIDFGKYQINGYYQDDMPNIVNIKSYEELDESTSDIVAHEFIHLCQIDYEYNVLTEAGAEIISNEYFKNSSINAYNYVVNEVKKLMEIIGPEPILYYNFTGDFKMVEDKVRPYFKDEEYQEFLRCLSINYYDVDEYNEKIIALDNIIAILYQNVYHKSIKDDFIINLIERNDGNLCRYYFNSRLINDENSYYIDNSFFQIERYSLDSAILNNIIKAKYNNSIRVSYDVALDLKDSGENIVTHLLDDGSIEYFLYQEKELTYEEYLKYKENDEEKIELIYSNPDYFDGKKVVHYKPVKRPLPTIYERKNQEYTKKRIHS